MSLKYAGIDEAGRGSVFGPLIIVGVVLNENNLEELLENGLKDSKSFLGHHGRGKREELALYIQDISLDLMIEEISAREIDETLKNRPKDNLNLLEFRYISKILLNIKSNNVKLDTLSSPSYSRKNLINYLKNMETSIQIKFGATGANISTFTIEKGKEYSKIVMIAKKADKIYPIVSAASCVAKTIRDKKLREIEKTWNLPHKILGQGYPNDKDINIMNFLKIHHEEIKGHKYPFIRYSWSWSTLQNILQPPLKKLDNYL